MFVDKALVHLKAGDGGKGMVSFAHEIFKPKGGPDGGDGGDGGNVHLVVDPNLNSLSFFITHKNIKAQNGEPGKNHKRRGKKGEDLVLKVPPGTIVFEDNKQIVDLQKEGKECLIAKGGKGGFGNAHFISSTRQAPQIGELGEPGEEKNIRLELKLIADIGLIGLPNVGKSTLLSVVSEARPKIADYPFTTLSPNLGVIKGSDFEIIAADIPGLIEGASKGKGLGDEFLRHIERTRFLVHILDGGREDLVKDFNDINQELSLYSKTLSLKPQLVVVNKIDILDSEKIKEIKDNIVKALKQKPFVLIKKPYFISAVTHRGVKELIYDLPNLLKKVKSKERPQKEEEYKVFTLEDVVEKPLEIIKEKNKFIIKDKKIETFAVKTDFSNPYSLDRLHDILKRRGILGDLKRKGAKPGDTLEIKGKRIKYKG